MTKERQADKRQNQNYLELNARVVRLLAQFQTLDLTSFVHVLKSTVRWLVINSCSQKSSNFVWN